MGSRILGDTALIVMGQSPAKANVPKNSRYIPLLNGPTEFTSHHPKPVQYTTDAKKIAIENDILFCVRGSTTGRMNWADRKYAIGRGIAAIRHKEDIRLQPLVRGVIEVYLPQLLKQATGSTFPNVSSRQLAEIPYPSLPLPEQRRIAHILGTLDDKIELNRKMNATLEAMAQALFKSWFVDFDPVLDNALAAGNPIPDELQEKAARRRALGDACKPLPEHIRKLFPSRFTHTDEMGWIPEGWEVKRIGDIIELAYGKSLTAKNRIPGEFPVYGSGGITGFHNKPLAKGPGVIIGRKGTVGSVYWEDQDFYPIDTVFYVNLLDAVPMFWVYQQLLQMDIGSMGADSAVPGVNRHAVLRCNWCKPDTPILQCFEERLAPIQQQISLRKSEMTALADLRDTLLPKLISGELRVDDAEKTVGTTC